MKMLITLCFVLICCNYIQCKYTQEVVDKDLFDSLTRNQDDGTIMIGDKLCWLRTTLPPTTAPSVNIEMSKTTLPGLQNDYSTVILHCWDGKTTISSGDDATTRTTNYKDSSNTMEFTKTSYNSEYTHPIDEINTSSTTERSSSSSTVTNFDTKTPSSKYSTNSEDITKISTTKISTLRIFNEPGITGITNPSSETSTSSEGTTEIYTKNPSESSMSTTKGQSSRSTGTYEMNTKILSSETSTPSSNNPENPEPETVTKSSDTTETSTPSSNNPENPEPETVTVTKSSDTTETYTKDPSESSKPSTVNEFITKTTEVLSDGISTTKQMEGEPSVTTTTALPNSCHNIDPNDCRTGGGTLEVEIEKPTVEKQPCSTKDKTMLKITFSLLLRNNRNKN